MILSDLSMPGNAPAVVSCWIPPYLPIGPGIIIPISDNQYSYEFYSREPECRFPFLYLTDRVKQTVEKCRFIHVQSLILI
jgi:hypothetical protein